MPRRRKNQVDEPAPIDGATGDEPSELSNSARRGETIRAAAAFLAEREAEIKAIREEINSYKATHIKGDLGFKLSDWNSVYRMYQLDGEDRDKLLDTIREGFAALGVGGQMDWLDAAEQADAAAATKPAGNGSGARNEAARQDGYTDGLAGVVDHADRWPQGTPGCADYHLGVGEGREQRERAQALAH